MSFDDGAIGLLATVGGMLFAAYAVAGIVSGSASVAVGIASPRAERDQRPTAFWLLTATNAVFALGMFAAAGRFLGFFPPSFFGG